MSRPLAGANAGWRCAAGRRWEITIVGSYPQLPSIPRRFAVVNAADMEKASQLSKGSRIVIRGVLADVDLNYSDTGRGLSKGCSLIEVPTKDEPK